jgi:hypothetical protein
MHFTFDRRQALAGFAVLLLAGCTTPPPAPKYPALTFTHLPPIRIEAASLEIVEGYQPPLTAPNVEHRMPVAPAAAVRRWAEDRLVPVGAAGRIVVTIEDAAVKEVALQRSGGVRGVVTTDQTERYDARLAVRVAVRNRSGSGEVSAEAARTRTVPEGLSLNEREKVWFEVTETLINDLNGELDAAIQEFLKPFLR